MKILLLLMAIIGAGLINTAAAQTPSAQASSQQASMQAPSPQSSSKCMDESYWNQLTDTQRREAVGKSFKSKNISDECFHTMVSGLFSVDKKLLEDSLTAVFSSRAAKGAFSQELLVSLFSNRRLIREKELWGKVIDIWSGASSMPVHSLLASLSEGGGIPVADTLYRALDAAGRLDAHELLRYGRVKSLMGDYRSAARIYCRVALDDRRVEHAAVTQMAQLFADADSADKVVALEEFRKCVLADPSSDTAFFRNWIADFYGRHGLFDREIAILTELDIPSAPSGRKLAEAAKGHFSKRRYRHAAVAAVAACGRLGPEDREQRTGAAFVAYQAYMQLGVRDSALVWLKLSEVTNKDARIQAAALHQETGHLAQAAALIDSIPPSLSKDTLLVRQLLFSGEPAKALNYILASTSTAWTMNPRDRMLWRGRCMIFGGQAYDAASVLDSIRFMPSWHGASETLRYRYWIQKLDDDRGALEVWGRLERLIYIGDLDGAVREAGRYRGMAGEAGEMLAVRLARALAKSSRFTEAIGILELVDGGGVDFGIKGIPKSMDFTPPRGPEYLYLKAEMLCEVGRQGEARVIAQKILADYPGDIFAQKARILLAKI